jgi:hypothetical protein
MPEPMYGLDEREDDEKKYVWKEWMMTFHKPTQWQLTPKGNNLLGNYVIPPSMDKLKGIISKQTS